MKMHAFATMLALGILVISPATSQTPAGASKSAPLVHAAETAATKPAAAQLSAGESTYKAACLACHQANGKGLAGAFPPLAGSDYLLKDKTRAITTVLHGKTGPIGVNKQQLDSGMPPMPPLSKV